MEKTRIYGNTVDIDSNQVQEFWNAKAKKDNTIKAVLCGNDFAENSGIIRNERECRILQNFIKTRELTILDIGCGIGRMAHNLKDNIKIYHGIDFSSEFIRSAKMQFKDNSNVEFFQMSAAEIDTSLLLAHYDLIIITGVLMYINDNELSKVFSICKRLQNDTGCLYVQESVSIMDSRLTLRDFHSAELQSKYNSIYRTRKEYEDYFAKYLSDYTFENNTDLLLDKNTGAREETNARWWYLCRK
jgi:ubiquinone/menaquinone biosynthesis C-methylase UbiE